MGARQEGRGGSVRGVVSQAAEGRGRRVRADDCLGFVGVVRFVASCAGSEWWAASGVGGVIGRD